MEIKLASRTTKIKPSPTLAINARAKELKASGGDIISLSVGEPDFDTPDFIKQAAHAAIDAGFTKYTAVDGTPELKQSIIEKFKRDNNLHYEPAQILVSAGAKQSLYNLFQALLDPDDEVIIPAPYWVSYPDMVLLTGAKPVFVSANFNQNYKITAQQLENAITDKTRLIIFNAPNNPTGMMYSKAELTEFAEVLIKYPNIIIVSDDIYEHILWKERPFSNILTVCPALTQRTVVVNGVSKAYSMTGWRIGYAAGPAPLIAAMKKIQSQSTSNPSSISQVAAKAALDGDQQCIQNMVKEFKQRHDFLLNELKAIPGFQCHASHGTFYLFPDVTGAIQKLDHIHNDIEFAEHLLIKTGIAVVPGSAFGMENCIRLSFATRMERLNDAVKRIKTIVI
jgi:aspartate aminotransferase